MTASGWFAALGSSPALDRSAVRQLLWRSPSKKEIPDSATGRAIDRTKMMADGKTSPRSMCSQLVASLSVFQMGGDGIHRQDGSRFRISWENAQHTLPPAIDVKIA